MRYDAWSKKSNGKHNDSCNLKFEKGCEKLAGILTCCVLIFLILLLLKDNVWITYCYADELSEDGLNSSILNNNGLNHKNDTKEDNTKENTTEDAEREQQKIKEIILSEIEYGEIDDSLRSLFPEKRIAFQD